MTYIFKWIFRFSPRVSDTSQWAEGNNWYSPHLALTPAAECTLEQREIKALVYIFMSIKQIWIWRVSVDVDHLLSISVFLYWHEYKCLISFITILSYAVDCVSYVWTKFKEHLLWVQNKHHLCNLPSLCNQLQSGRNILLSPLPMTRVNWPAMSPSEMGVAGESPSQGGGLWDWKPSGADSLSAPVFVASEGEAAVSGAVAESGAICAALGGL